LAPSLPTNEKTKDRKFRNKDLLDRKEEKKEVEGVTYVAIVL
jgi:hypothetical protein